NLDNNQVLLRESFDAARIDRHDLAIRLVQQAVNGAGEEKMKGYLKQILAEHTNFIDPARAQEIQLAALSHNSRVLRPLAGVTYSKLSAPPGGQASAALNFMNRFLEGNELIIWVNALLEDLTWGEEGSNRFEAAMYDLGGFLGFGSQRPEASSGRGPDNLWALGAL